MATAPTEVAARRLWHSLIEKVVPADLSSRRMELPEGGTITLKRDQVISKMWERTVSAHDP